MTEKLTSEEREALFLAADTHTAGGRATIARYVEKALTAHVAAAVAEARETVAREIEAIADENDEYGMDVDAGTYRAAAHIARHGGIQ